LSKLVFSQPLINVLYLPYLMSENKTWEVLTEPWMEGALASLISLNLIIGIMLMAKRMLLLEASGASVGFGVQSVTQTVGRQRVVFSGGEWREVPGTPKMQMYIAILTLIVATIVLACRNTMAKV